MPKYHVRIEASAAVFFDLQIQALNEQDAESTISRRLNGLDGRTKGSLLERKLNEMVEELMIPEPETVKSLAQKLEVCVAHMGLELDENGFHILDTDLVPQEEAA